MWSDGYVSDDIIEWDYEPSDDDEEGPMEEEYLGEVEEML